MRQTCRVLPRAFGLVLLALAAWQVHAQALRKTESPQWPFNITILADRSIVVAEIDSLRPSGEGGAGYEQMLAHVRVDRILRDAHGLGMGPCDLNVSLRRSAPPYCARALLLDAVEPPIDRKVHPDDGVRPGLEDHGRGATLRPPGGRWRGRRR